MTTAVVRIMERIHRSLGGPGAVVTPKDFLDLAGRAAVDQALGRLVRKGALTRIGRGLYHLPRTNPKLGVVVPPDPDVVADSIGRQTGRPVAPSGADTANRLGLTTQIPARSVYLTTGRSRSVQVGNQTIRFKHVSPRRLPDADPLVIRLLQALHDAGPHPEESTLDVIRAMLTDRQRHQLLRHAKYAAGWVADSARRLAHEPANAEAATRG